ncbi:DB module domain-containing protein [Ditylenchus destructor]|uniref:DB module domain-containing protein n=1 Tax=Ditylenchus destructor TaxID=166010 RepID=A0AAD4QYU1_9BILA|nr:DB module domain-containing protein [Ditylenchus destructor]
MIHSTFTFCLFGVLAVLVGELCGEDLACQCAPACHDNRACCGCMYSCVGVAYTCQSRCGGADWECLTDCVKEGFDCAKKCLNREFESCCLEKRVKIGLPCNYSALLEHPAQERSSSALLAGQNNDRSTIDYFLCLTRGEDNTQCCRDAGVGDDCLDLCKPMDQNPDIGRCANPSEAFKAFGALASCSSNVQLPFGQ